MEMLLAAVLAASLDLLRSAVDPNPTLQSYTASATLSAVLHAIVPVRERFNGTAYYLKPKRKIVFNNVPGPLASFRTLASTTPTYDEAIAEYTITPLTDDGRLSSYSLVPKKTGARVTKLVVTVDDQRALITRAVWSYTNGGKLSFNQAYETTGSYRLATTIDVSARFPEYRVDGTIRLSDFKTNVDIPPSIFADGK